MKAAINALSKVPGARTAAQPEKFEQSEPYRVLEDPVLYSKVFDVLFPEPFFHARYS